MRQILRLEIMPLLPYMCADPHCAGPTLLMQELVGLCYDFHDSSREFGTGRVRNPICLMKVCIVYLHCTAWTKCQCFIIQALRQSQLDKYLRPSPTSPFPCIKFRSITHNKTWMKLTSPRTKVPQISPIPKSPLILFPVTALSLRLTIMYTFASGN